MDNLVAQQKVNLNMLERQYVNFKKAPKSRRTVIYAEKIAEKLKSAQSDFETIDKQIMELLTGDANELQLLTYFSEGIRAQFDDMHLEFDLEVQELINENRVHTVPNLPELKNTRNADSEEISLPRISIPKFSSKYEDWVAFRDMFSALIHDRKTLSKVQKLHYLKCSLVGDSELLIKHLAIKDSNYDIAWKIICERYNNPQALLNVQFKRLFSLGNASETATSLRMLLDRTVETTLAIEAMGLEDLWQATLVFLTAQRLPPETRQSWENEVSASPESLSFNKLKTFLEHRFRALETAGTDRCHSKPQASGRHVHNTYQITKSNSSCPMCEGDHRLFTCEQFWGLNSYGKLNFVKRKALCINCLGIGHRAANCPSKRRCSKCNQAHHTLLHRVDMANSSALSANQHNVPVTKQVGIHSVSSTSKKDVLLATALVTVLSPNGKITLRALLDQGSQTSLITEGAVQLLGLTRKRSKMCITGINGSASTNVRGVTRVELLTSSNEIISFDALILERLTNLIPNNALSTKLLERLGDISLADPQFYLPNNIDMLLGADSYARLLLDGVIRIEDGAVAQRTKLGWILSGEMTVTERNVVQTYMVEVGEDSNAELNEQLKKFWEIEEGPRAKPLNDDDIKCEAHFISNTRRQEDGRFIVSFPFKSQQAKESIGHSRHIAKASFDALERKFERNVDLKNTYKKSINDFIEAGYLCLVKPEEMILKGNYLPHHAVFRESTSTQTRVVFDASRKSSSGVSLNDALLTGPAIQNELIAVLMRFRIHRYAYVADISKMFCQVHMTNEDSQYQRIVWRSDPSEVLRDYRLTRVAFGTTCAPFLAIRTLHKLAEEEQSIYPLGAQMIRDDFYVDDMLSGDNDLATAVRKRQEVNDLLEAGGFKLRKWLANDKRLLDGIPEADIEMGDTLDLDLDRSFKSLGMQWQPNKDYFSFRINLPRRSQHTKRTILSDVASLYDPLGWISPVIISLKILLRTIWQCGCSWDSELPSDIEAHWVHLRESLKDIRLITIPRWILGNKNNTTELHGFCDASQEAYAAVVYLVTRGVNEPKVRLLFAKTKVAPIKTISIPKSELCGAVLLSKLVRKVKEVYSFTQIATWLWCDNTTVLSWLQGHPSRWSIFVANRTVEIFENVSNTPWRHVPSQQNPADLGSRGVMAMDLVNNKMWWNGPDWLKLEHDNWPKQDRVEETDQEMRKKRTFNCLTIQNSELDQLLGKFSCLTKLIRVTAYCLKFRAVALKLDPPRGYLTSKELNESLEFWVKYIQKAEFEEEMRRIKARKPLKGRYQIVKLNPYIDEGGILRVGGRLNNACMTNSERHPMIIPKFGRFTELVLDHAHKATLHGQTQLMLNYIRKRFWIIDGRNAIRHLVHKCVTCFRCKAETSKQLMADLPSPRVNITRPFTHTGIDYCGPFTIRDRKGRGFKTTKCYVAVFICLAVKAIHIEVVSDMTVDAFLAALQRFFARRGFSSHIYSDCGSNFIGAEAELTRIIRNNSTMLNTIMSQGVTWHFNPPASPHFGGLWEAGVKSLKFHMRRIIGNALLTFEEFNTVLIQVEACLNSRPLCPITDDPTDDTALTPGHFLVGDSLLAPPQHDVTEIQMNRLDRWQLTQRLSQGFWKRWSNEYLQLLQQRTKWVHHTPNINIGDLCLVKEDRIPPYKWPLARITETHPGKDGLVRVVTIRMKGSTFKRPIVKIALLPKTDSP